MANAQANLVLCHIRELVSARSTANLSDSQLLKRFTSDKEQAAFQALVHRHGPFVLGVCRRLLHNWHDAEDAFQATFLVLARSARSISKCDSLSSWLHQVAFRVANKARIRAAKRRLYERQAAKSEPADPLEDVTVRELLVKLDEELQSLPARYRGPLLLCHLQEKTRDEAARQLGCSLSTLKRRLEQGRERLRNRLARRGLTLSAAILTASLAQEAASGAVPGMLAVSTVKAALLAATGKATGAGMVSASASTLADAVLKTMFATKLKIASALLLAVSVVGAGVGIFTHRVVAQTTVPPAAQAEPDRTSGQEKQGSARPQISKAEKSVLVGDPADPSKPEENQKITVTGRVLDAAGKPIKDAQVAVVSRPRRRLHAWEWANHRFDVLDSGHTDGDGRFRLSAPPPTFRVLEPVAPPWPRDETALIVASPGHGVAWRSLEGEMKPSEIVISLTREQTIRGRLIDLQGQPAAGVRLVVALVVSKTPAKNGEAIYFRVPPEKLPPWPKPVITDDQGRFVLRGIGPGQIVTLEVRDDRFARQHFNVETGTNQASKEVSFSVTGPRLIRGRVIYADTRRPVPNIRLSVWASRGRTHLGAVDGRTDAQGRFRINAFPGDSFGISAFAPEGEPYLNPYKRLEWPKGAVQQEIEIALPRGVLARGTITEVGSGKPVAGATVEYWPYRSSNPDVVSGVTVWTTSGPDGSFRLALPQGKGHLLVNGPVPDYIPQTVGSNDLNYGKPGGSPNYFHAVLPLDLKPEDKRKDVPVTLRRGVTIKGYLVGPDDKRVTRAQILCGGRPAPLERYTRPLPIWDGRFELRGCDPERTYTVLFLTAPYTPGINGIGVGRRAGQMKLHLAPFFGGTDWLGAAVQLSAKQAKEEPIKVRLAPCGSVVIRLVNGREKLQPLINLSPPLDLVVTPGPYLDEAWDQSVMGGEIVALCDTHHWTPVAGARTDAQGRLTLTGLIPGATYRVNNLDLTPAKDFTVESAKGSKPAEITVPLK